MTNKFHVANDTKIFKRISESFNKQNFLSYIGAKLESAKYGQVTISCNNRNELTQQQGLLHGGVIATIADVTCGYTALSVMPEDFEVLSVEFKINLLRPATADQIIATGNVVKNGKTLVITEAEVRDAQTDKIIAKILATMIPSHIKK